MGLSSYFIWLLNVSIAASYVAAAIIVLRLIFKKIPKWTMCVLWGLVALRLILPFTPESAFSLVPSAKTVPENIVKSSAPAIDSGLPAVDAVINPVITKTAEKVGAASVVNILSIIWASGFALMLIYSLVVYIKLRRRTRESIEIEEGVFICDRIDTPFLFGFIKPKIYVPSWLSGEDLEYVIAHETAHMSRFDHVWKPVGFMLLSLHWFNPALWAAYILLCRDIEFACDEKVISLFGEEHKKAYSTALLNCSIPKHLITACPVAFGETSVKGRIVNVLRYKKPAVWVLVASAISIAVLSVCFLTNPVKAEAPKEEPERQVTVFPDGGDHEYIEEIIHSPSCTSGGSTKFTCVKCGKNFVALVPASGHDYTGEVTTKADCTTREITTYTCTVCGDSYNVEGDTPRGEHEYKSEVTTAASCSTREITTHTCVFCGDSYSVEGDFAPNVHNYERRVGSYATCYIFGCDINYCVDCGDWYMVEIYHLTEHTFDPTSSTPDLCVVCGRYIYRYQTDDFAEADGIRHSYSLATCTEPEICRFCGKTRGEPKGHKFEIEDGVMRCYVCGKEG